MNPYYFLVMFFFGAVGFIVANEVMSGLEYAVVIEHNETAEIEYRTLLMLGNGSLVVSVVSIFRAGALCAVKTKRPHKHKVSYATHRKTKGNT